MNSGVAWLPSARAVKWSFGFAQRAQPLSLITNIFFYVYINLKRLCVIAIKGRDNVKSL